MEDKPHYKLMDGRMTATVKGRTYQTDALRNIHSNLNTMNDPRTYNQFDFMNFGIEYVRLCVEQLRANLWRLS